MFERFNLPKDKGAYVDDLAYIEEEMIWVELRLRRLGAAAELERRAADEESDDASSYPRHGKDVPAETLRRRWRQYADKESMWRTYIDGRLAAHQHLQAPPLVLDVMCAQLGLSSFERQVLLLAASLTFSRRFGPLLSALGEEMYERVTIEAAFRFGEKSLREMMELRPCFGPHGPLVAHDLLVMEHRGRARELRDFLELECVMPSHVFERLVGRVGLDEELRHLSSIEDPRATFDQVVLPQRERELLSVAVERHDEVLQLRAEWGFDATIRYGRALTLLFEGPPSTGKTFCAEAIAGELGRRLIVGSLPTLVSSLVGSTERARAAR